MAAEGVAMTPLLGHSNPDVSENTEYTGLAHSLQRNHIQHATTKVQTLMNFVKGNMATIILTLPYAVGQGGLLIGLLRLLLICVIATLCMIKLVECSHFHCKRVQVSSLDYGEVAEETLRYGPIQPLRNRASVGRFVVNTLLILLQLGYCCVYLLAMAENVQQIYIVYYGDSVPRVELFVLLLYPLVLLYTYIRNLDELAPFTSVANILIIIGLLVVFEYMFSHIGVEAPLKDIRLVNNFHGVCIFFGTAMSAFEVVSLVLPMENKMKEPHHFKKILVLGMLVVGSCCLTMAILGYVCFGDNLKETITLNLPTSLLYVIVRVMFVFSIFFTYAVQIYVPISIMWPSIKRQISNPKYHDVAEYIFRSLLVLLTVILAIAVPKLSLFTSLLGAFCGTTLVILFPTIMEELTLFSQGYKSGSAKIRLVFNLLLILFGLVGFVVSTYVSLYELVLFFKPNSTPKPSAI